MSVILNNCVFLSPGQLRSSLERELTVVNKFDDSATIAYVWKDGMMGLPRYSHKFWWTDEIDDQRVEGDSIDFGMTSSYREGQKEIIDEVMNTVEKGGTGFLIVAPTSVGKTFIGIKLIQQLGRRALVVVPKSDLIEQWKGELLAHTTITEDRIGIGESGHTVWKGKDIVISLADTLSKDREGEEFKKQFGVVIFDEVDKRIPATTLNSVLSLMPARYRIALTATPNRRDGLGQLFLWHVGENVIRSDAGKKMLSGVIIHRYKGGQFWIADDLPVIKRKTLYLTAIQKDQTRNRLIADYASKFYLKAYRCIVLSDRTFQLQQIYQILTNDFSVPEVDIGYYTASLFDGYTWKNRKRVRKSITISAQERERVAAECSIMLGTYGMLGVGTNIPELNGLILASPQVSSEQAIGRIERYLEGKRAPMTVDIVDENSPDAKRWASARQREYIRRGLKIITN